MTFPLPPVMLPPSIPKYPAEFVLEFYSVDRFLYRVSDLYELGELVDPELFERVNNCHLYLLGTRPRISVLPDSIQATDEIVQFAVEYKCAGVRHESLVAVPRNLFLPREVSFEAAPYPHRELVTRDSNGDVVAQTLLANYAHLIPGAEQCAKDMEIVYVGKGLRRSANDRLANHNTLQKILAHIHSNEPDKEVSVLIYNFRSRKNLLSLQGVPAEITGENAKRRRQRVLDYKPPLGEQVSLIEASVISYFHPDEFNEHYLDFPNRTQRILKNVYAADFAAITVQLDNTNIAGPRIYSKRVPPSPVHDILIDFRRLEGRFSFFKNHLPPSLPRDTS